MIGRIRAIGCRIACVGVFVSLCPPAQAQPASSLLDHLQLHISAALLDELSRQPVDEELAVRDNILDVPVEGRARLTGTTRLLLVPNADRAVFELVLQGTAKSATTGRSPPVSIRSEAVTRFTATKRFYLDDGGLSTQPAVCRAETDSTVTAVETDWPGMRGWLVRRIAWRRVHNSHDEADGIASRHAERDLGRAFDRHCEPLIEQANALLASSWLRGNEGSSTRRLCFHTTPEQFHAAITPSRDGKGLRASLPTGESPAMLAVPVHALSVTQSLQLLGAWLREGPAGLARELTGQPLSSEAVAWLASSSTAGPRLSTVPSLADGWFRLTFEPAKPPATHVSVAQRSP